MFSGVFELIKMHHIKKNIYDGDIVFFSHKEPLPAK